MLIIGTGGLASDILSSIEFDENTFDDIVFYNDTDIKPLKYIADNFHVITNESGAQAYFKETSNEFIVAVGDNKEREKLSKKFENLGGNNITYISKYAHLGRYVKIAKKGVIIMEEAVIKNDVEIGEGSIIYTNSGLGHNTAIGKYALISSEVCMSNVSIGDYSFLGIGSVIKPGVQIGKGVITGTGAAVINSVDDNQIVYGNPAKMK